MIIFLFFNESIERSMEALEIFNSFTILATDVDEFLFIASRTICSLSDNPAFTPSFTPSICFKNSG